MNDPDLLLDLVERYFDGLYRGDTHLLRGVFHPEARLFGEVKGQVLLRELEPYLQVVASRRSPMQNGEARCTKVIGLQIHGAIAVATLRCDMLGFNYVDELALLKQDGRWSIVNKLYTHLEA